MCAASGIVILATCSKTAGKSTWWSHALHPLSYMPSWALNGAAMSAGVIGQIAILRSEQEGPSGRADPGRQVTAACCLIACGLFHPSYQHSQDGLPGLIQGHPYIPGRCVPWMNCSSTTPFLHA